MSTVITMNTQQMSDALLTGGIKPSNSGVLSGLLVDTKPKGRNASNSFEWPDEVGGGIILSELNAKPLGHFVSFSVNTLDKHFIFSGHEEDHFALLTVSGENVVVAHGFVADQVKATCLEILRPMDCAAGADLGFKMTMNGMLALFAILDRIRLLLASSLVTQIGLPSLVFSIDDLSEQLTSGTNGKDYRWLCAIHAELSGSKTKISKTALKAGCNELESSGFLESQKKGKELLFIPDFLLISVALDLLIPLPAILLSDPVSSFGAALISGKSPWLMRQQDEFFIFENAPPAAMAQLVQNVLDVILERASWSISNGGIDSEIGEPGEASNLLCGECGVANDSDSKFCKSCGNNFNSPSDELKFEEAAACPKCGNEFQTSKKFCTNCGAERM